MQDHCVASVLPQSRANGSDLQFDARMQPNFAGFRFDDIWVVLDRR
jgi:hypothetical protein